MVYKYKNYLSLTNITHTFSKPCVRFSTFNGFLVMTGSIHHSGHEDLFVLIFVIISIFTLLLVWQYDTPHLLVCLCRIHRFRPPLERVEGTSCRSQERREILESQSLPYAPRWCRAACAHVVGHYSSNSSYPL